MAARLGLTPEPISTQVIPRDRHAVFFAALAVIASGIERLATEVRHLQRTEVGEVAEPFAAGQKGSSAMPHKQNPVLAENLTGLARLVRAAVIPALENVALWHERDIAHSSVERVIAPDTTIALDFALHRLAGLIEGLQVDPARMRENLERTKGLIHSQRCCSRSPRPACPGRRPTKSSSAVLSTPGSGACRSWISSPSRRSPPASPRSSLRSCSTSTTTPDMSTRSSGACLAPRPMRRVALLILVAALCLVPRRQPERP